MKSLSRVWLFAIQWTVVHQAPLSMGFSRQEYWGGLPFPSPGIFPTQGLNPGLPHCRHKVCIKRLTDETVLLLLTAICLHLPIWVSSFSFSPLAFLLSQITPFYVVSLLPNLSSYSYFFCLSSFSFFFFLLIFYFFLFIYFFKFYF